MQRAAAPDMVVVPGLGALGYLLPMIADCSSWTRVHLLDVPGFGDRRTARCPATLADVSHAVAQWLHVVPKREVILFGHSTGAQAALRAAAAVPDRVAAVVLAGPTFPPALRTWPPLVAAMLRTLVHESPAELAAIFPDYLRGRRGVVTLLRTSLTDDPEKVVPDLACPVILMRGRHDAVSPAGWAAHLAASARRGRVVTVPGSHNFTYTNPERAATALRDALGCLAGGVRSVDALSARCGAMPRAHGRSS